MSAAFDVVNNWLKCIFIGLHPLYGLDKSGHADIKQTCPYSNIIIAKSRENRLQLSVKDRVIKECTIFNANGSRHIVAHKKG